MKIPPRPSVVTRETVRWPLLCHATSIPFGNPRREYRRDRGAFVIDIFCASAGRVASDDAGDLSKRISRPQDAGR